MIGTDPSHPPVRDTPKRKLALCMSAILLVGACQSNASKTVPESGLLKSYYACVDADSTQYIRNIAFNPGVSQPTALAEMTRLRHEGKCKLFPAGYIVKDAKFSDIKNDLLRFNDERDGLTYWPL